MGRRPLESKELYRDQRLYLHLSKDEEDMLYDIVEKLGMSRPEFIRGLIHVHWHQTILGERMTPERLNEVFSEGMAYGNYRKRLAKNDKNVQASKGCDGHPAEGDV